MKWQLLCPLCKGSNSSGVDSLSKLRDKVHCNLCNIEYNPKFSSLVEMVFTPKASVREVSLVKYCGNNPCDMRHIVTLFHILKDETIEHQIKLPEGRYALRLLSGKKDIMVHLKPDAKNNKLDIKLSKFSDLPDSLELTPEFMLTLEDDIGYAEKFQIIDSGIYDYASTADMVASNQTFRDLFGSDALRMDTQLAVGSLTFLFTDLKNSTMLYDTEGDVNAFSLVQDHFKILIETVDKNNGAVVKTMGDAIMASFERPEDGVKAALDIQKYFRNEKILSETNVGIKVRIGVHKGPCLIVGANDKLDYFGTTVNMAARFEGKSKGGDIILSNSVMLDKKVENMLNQEAVRKEFTEVSLKGIKEKQKLCHLVFE